MPSDPSWALGLKKLYIGKNNNNNKDVGDINYSLIPRSSSPAAV